LVLEEAGDEVGIAFRDVFRSKYWRPDPHAYKTDLTKANLSGLLIMVALAMHAAYDMSANVTSDVIPFLLCFKEEVDAIHSLAAMVFGTAKSKVSSIGKSK